MKKIKNGIICYTIAQDGCLEGVFSNEQMDGTVFEEVANKITEDLGELTGDYKCFYFDGGNHYNDVLLKIRLSEGKNKTYNVAWEHDNQTIYKGVGYKLQNKQFIVHYQED